MSGLLPPFPTRLHGVHRENATFIFHTNEYKGQRQRANNVSKNSSTNAFMAFSCYKTQATRDLELCQTGDTEETHGS